MKSSRPPLPKAKELRRHAEPLITLAKEDTPNNRRLAFFRTGCSRTVTKLFAEIAPRYRDRPGGYLRVLKGGYRRGDAAPLAWVELVDRPDQLDGAEFVPADRKNLGTGHAGFQCPQKNSDGTGSLKHCPAGSGRPVIAGDRTS